MSPPTTPPLPTRRTVALLALLGLAEYILIRTCALPIPAAVYPRWSDQIQYLTEAYQGFEYSRTHGFWSGVHETLVNGSAQGTLHDFWAVLLFSITGPSRTAALTLNVLAFLAVQAFTFFVVTRVTRRPALAWIAAALQLALLAPWNGGPGSLIDFRLDWMAACAYGIATAAALASRGFRSTRWSIAFGFIVGIVLLTRFLTGVYFALEYIGLLAIALAGPGRLARVGRILLSGTIAALLAGPLFWLNRVYIYNYYWVGHVTGPERQIRDSHLDRLESIRWTLSEIASAQLGWPLLIGLVGSLAALLLLRRAPQRSAAADDQTLYSDDPIARSSAVPTALLFLVVPAAVLTLHPSKAVAPVNIVVYPALWIALLAIERAARRVTERSLRAVAATGCALALGVFILRATRTPYSGTDLAGAKRLNALTDYIYYRSETAGLAAPRVASTLVSDAWLAGTLNLLGYERHHYWANLEQRLPTSLFAPTPAVMMDQLANSDFVLLLSAPGVTWPFDRASMEIYPQMKAWCDAHLQPLADFSDLGFAVRVYERPTLAHPTGAAPLSLPGMLASAAAAPLTPVPEPPGPPFFTAPPHLLVGQNTPFSLELPTAFRPVVYSAEHLPTGVELEPATGRLHGRLPQRGTYKVPLAATNRRGTSSTNLTVEVTEKTFAGEVQMPATAHAGEPVPLEFAAFDAASTLDFLDITDLTTVKVLDRLVAGPGGRATWQGLYTTSFREPGVHHVAFRFVRYDGHAATPYTFLDELHDITIAP